MRGTLHYAQWNLKLIDDETARAALLKSAEQDLRKAVNGDGSLASAYASLSSLDYALKDVPSGLSDARAAYNADAYLTNADVILSRLFWASHDLEQFSEAQKWCAEGARRYPRDHRFVECRLWLQLIPNAKTDIPEAWRLKAMVDSVAPKAQRAYWSRYALQVVGGIIGKTARQGGAGALQGPLADSARRVLGRDRVGVDLDPTQELMGTRR